MPGILHTPPPNGVRLTLREWLIVGVIVVIVLWGIVPFWHARSLRVTLPENFRLSYTLRDDYLLYRSVAAVSAAKHPTLFLGDSVIWGMYVKNDSTLTACLNRKLGRPECGNLAVDGLHPVALHSLLRHYGQPIRDRRVFLYLNPLWLTSPLYDLTADGDLSVNHPRLLPQFDPRLKPYHASLDDRCRAAWEQTFDFPALLHHARTAFFDNADFKKLLATKPQDPFLAKLSLDLTPDETKHPHNSLIDWYDAGIEDQDWPWLDLRDSRQWQAYLDTLAILQKQHNTVIPVIGTVNPHLQTPASLEKYRKIRQNTIAELTQLGYAPLELPDLPSEEYGDASHPLAPGYERLAQFILDHSTF